MLSANTAWFITNFCKGLIETLRQAGYEPVVAAPRDAAAEAILADMKVRCCPVDISRSGVNPATDTRLLLQYRRLLRNLRPAAYLGFTIKPNIYGSLACGQLGIPTLPTVTGLGTAFIRSGPLQWIVTRLYRAAFRKLPVVFFQNEADRTLFVERGIVRAGRARVVPGFGIDCSRFAPSAAPDGPPVFLLVARLLRDKGVDEFVEAARLLRSELPAARFQLLGPVDKDNRTAVRRADIDRWVSEGVIEYLGETDDVRPSIAASTAVVLPSYREGLPQALLEAGAMGRAVVATDVPGCRDVVTEGATGLLCVERDATALADAMRRLANLPADRRLAMGRAARTRVEENFSQAVALRAYIEALDVLTSAQSGR